VVPHRGPTALTVDGYLYLSMSDQDLKIDATNGDVADKHASIYPVGAVGRYLYLSDGTLSLRAPH
jgi:hypothetical protein